MAGESGSLPFRRTRSKSAKLPEVDGGGLSAVTTVDGDGSGSSAVTTVDGSGSSPLSSSSEDTQNGIDVCIFCFQY